MIPNTAPDRDRASRPRRLRLRAPAAEPPAPVSGLVLALAIASTLPLATGCVEQRRSKGIHAGNPFRIDNRQIEEEPPPILPLFRAPEREDPDHGYTSDRDTSIRPSGQPSR